MYRPFYEILRAVHGKIWQRTSYYNVLWLKQDLDENVSLTSNLHFSSTGFVPIRLPNGLSIVQGRTITSFTNAEEFAANFENVVPFLLETKLRRLGAHFISGPNFKPNVQVRFFANVQNYCCISLLELSLASMITIRYNFESNWL